MMTWRRRKIKGTL